MQQEARDPVTVEVMDRFNRLVQAEIELYEERAAAGEAEKWNALALGLAQIKLTVNRTFLDRQVTCGTEISKDRSADLAGREVR